MKKSTIAYILLTLSIVLIALVGLSKTRGAESNMLITNTADSAITDVTVSDGVNSWSLGDLDSLESSHMQERFQGEDPLRVSWQWDGEARQSTGCNSSAVEAIMEIDGQSAAVVCR